MRTFVTGMVFMSVLTAALSWLLFLVGGEFTDQRSSPVTAHAGEPLARFEPSSPAVVDAMLSIADVTKEDMVYDLGCGDGRIVISAARKQGAHGVGVDIDPQLIQDSRRNAEKDGVSHLVQFFEQDLVMTDISAATVVMLYLSPGANLMLRPKLLKELEPGTRVVSHSHDMGEWRPDREVSVENHRIYSWFVPSEVSGTWSIEIGGKYASGTAWIEFSQHFQKIAAKLVSGETVLPLSGALLNGRLVEFTIDQKWGTIAAGARFIGQVEKNRITGTFAARNHSGNWSAARTR